MDKNQLKHIIKEEYQNVKSFMEDKYGFTPELGKVISNPYAKSFVNEVSEPEVISQLRDIVNKKQNKKIKDPKSGKMMRVDMFSASAVTKVYDAINKSNKEKFSKLSLPKMVNVAFTVMKKESVNEAYIVLYAPKKGVKPVTTAAYKDKKDAEKWAKDLGGVTMIVKRKVKGIDEGKKRYNVMYGVGSSKYTVNFHDGKSKHKDGSDFFDIAIFKNKKDLAKKINDLTKQGYIYSYQEGVNEGVFSNLDLIRQNSKDARDFIKNVFKDDDFKDMKNDREFLKYLKSIYEGFASDAQRRAAFASGYKAKGKKGKKESIEEYDVENYQDVKEFIEFMREYVKDPYALNPTVTEAEYQGRDVKLGKIMQGDVKKFKVYVKNPKGNVVKVNFGHKGKGGEKTMRIKKSDPARRKAFRSRHNCDNPGPRHKARYWACRTW